MPEGFVRKLSGTWYEKYAYTIEVPSVQWAAVNTIVGDSSVPEQRCRYSPLASWKARSPTNGYRLSSSGKPSVIADAEIGMSASNVRTATAWNAFFMGPSWGFRDQPGYLGGEADGHAADGRPRPFPRDTLARDDRPRRRSLRQLHVQPRAADRGTRSGDRGRQDRRGPRGGPRRPFAGGRRPLARPRASSRVGLLPRPAPSPPADDAGARGLPWSPSARDDARRHDRSRRARAREGVARPPPRPRDPRRHPLTLRGRAVSLSGRPPGFPALGARAHRVERGRARDGSPAPGAPALRRAVPSRVDPDARGPPDRGELPGAGLELGRRAAGAVGERRGVGRDLASRGIHRDERSRRHPLELVDEPIGPAIVDGPLEVPVAAVVGDDQSEAFHRAQDDLALLAEPADVVPAPEAEPRPHRGAVVVVHPGLVSGRPDVAPARARDREPERVIDPRVVAEDLAVADQPGQDRQPGGVGARPTGRPEIVGDEVEDRAAAGTGVPGVPPSGEQFVERARVLIDHDRVPIGASLDPD